MKYLLFIVCSNYSIAMIEIYKVTGLIQELSLIFVGLLYASLRRGRRASGMIAFKFMCMSMGVVIAVPMGEYRCDKLDRLVKQ